MEPEGILPVTQSSEGTESKDEHLNQPQTVLDEANKVAQEKKSRKRHPSYRKAIYNVLKKNQPTLGVSKNAMEIMQSFMTEMFEMFVREASNLARCDKRTKISVRDMKEAVRLILTGKLLKHAEMAGDEAVVNVQISNLQL